MLEHMCFLILTELKSVSVRDKTHLQQQYKLREPLNRLHHQSIEGQTVFTGLLAMLYKTESAKLKN